MYLSRITTALVTVIILSTSLTAGGIKGTVKYDGKVPKMRPIKMAADPICNGLHTEGPARLEWLLAGPNGELKNVFVYVEEGLEGKKFPVPEKSVTMDQKGCLYVPHVMGVQVGQKIDILNSDGTLHNVHALPKQKKNDAFNEAMPGARKKITKQFGEPEVMLKMKCDVHPWMGAYIGVLNHPFYAVTDEKGNFEIKDLPPGTYTVKVWHERLPAKTATVTVKAEGDATADFVLKRPPKK
jgi:plastocyanin